MNKKKVIIFFVCALILLATKAVFLRMLSSEDSWICENGKWSKHGNPKSDPPKEGCGKSDGENASNSKEAFEAEEEKIEEMPDKNGEPDIIVDLPDENDSVGLPIIISGKARTFESTVNYRIKNDEGKVIFESYTTADSEDIGQLGPFKIEKNYPDPGTEKGGIEVFEYSAKDGSEINKVKIPVSFKKVENQEIKIFLGNKKEDPDSEECSEVFEIARRIPKTNGVAKAAISELIGGTSLGEEEDGYFSDINSATKIKSLTVSGGIAKIDFSKEILDGIEGTCETETIKSQVRKTLLQFATVKEVEIKVEGKESPIS